MTRTTKVALATTLFLLFAPTSLYARRAPDWVDGTSKKYPEPRYFIGVGAVSLEKGGKKQVRAWAADRARAEIAKTIRTQVEVTTRAERQVTAPGQKRSQPVEARSVLSEVVVALASEVLEGVEVKEYYKDRKGKMIYALAVLDRPKAARGLQDRVARHKEIMLVEMEDGSRYQREGRPLMALRHYNRALRESREVANLNELIGILKPTGPYLVSEMARTEADIMRIMRGLRRQLRFTVEVTGPAAGVRNYLIQGLAVGGYVTRGAKSASGLRTYELKGITDLTYRGTMKMGPDLTVHIYQADLDLEVVDPQTDEIVGTVEWSAIANEKQIAMAQKSAVRALGRLVRDQAADRLADVL